MDRINIHGEYITHKAFGRGQVVEHGDGFVTVLFSAMNENKKFIYPDAIETFLVLENEGTAKLFRESSDVIANNKAMERKDAADRLALEKLAVKEHAKQLKKAMKKPAKKPIIKLPGVTYSLRNGVMIAASHHVCSPQSINAA